ncbi:MAG: hypothetical protein CVV18_05000 [Gammaproteobacteria bacterium HGW-Gammaproteobacteria-8]|nr:MAG: hypothetical protein CVV18_05000 [Gammaproteobacteria bacterium HGW-Gammaproteobacteria-8]
MSTENGTDTGKSRDIPPRYSETWIERMDGRTQVARAIRDRLEALQSDLGGPDSMSYQQRSLSKRAIWMEAVIEQQEIALSKGEEIDQGKLTQAVNTLIGLLKTLGLERKARDVPDLHQWMKRKEAAKQ